MAHNGRVTDTQTRPIPSGADPARPTTRILETHGVDVIAEADRKGRPRDQFWPWCSGNILLLQMAWGAYVLDFGISFTQALLISVFGVAISFFVVGLVALVGKRGSAPTMVLSRAVFGVHGNFLPGLVAYLLMLGWETVNVAVAVLASGTIGHRLGLGLDTARVIGLVVVVGSVVSLGVLGFDVVMRAQKYFGWVTLAMSLVYIALTAGHVHWGELGKHPAGNFYAVLGASLLVFCGFGLGWTTAGGDYSRYLPRSASSRGLVGWTTLGGALPVVLLMSYGLLLCATDPTMASAMGEDPMGAITSIVPGWFLVPFWIFALCGLIAGATLDLYSSGLVLLAIGLPVKRWQAAGIDGVLMSLATVYVVWFSTNFLVPFEGFLTSLGVLEAAWTGIFLADLLVVRWRAGYDELKLFDSSRRGYGSVRWVPFTLMVACCWLGFGLVTNSSAPWLAWQGYLLGPLGLGGRQGNWAITSIGTLLALVVGFVAYLPLARRQALAHL